jgi:hypothetical protein
MRGRPIAFVTDTWASKTLRPERAIANAAVHVVGDSGIGVAAATVSAYKSAALRSDDAKNVKSDA